MQGSPVDWLPIALAVALLAAGATLLIVVRDLRDARAEIQQLRRQLTATTTPAPRGLLVAGRAMKAVVDTAVRVRDHGVSGMLTSSIEDLTRWVSENRTEIASVAAPDGTVTIFFSDIEDSTALNERIGDEGWVRLLHAHDRVVRAQVLAHGGHVVKTQGDGFMVVFSQPSQGVRAAFGIQESLSGGRGRLRRTQLKVRIGVHVGAVVSRDGDYFGRNVALAARVAALAAGGETLASAAVHDALADDQLIVFEGLGEVELRGLTGTHQVWRVSAA